jgi:hypothetical protein
MEDIINPSVLRSRVLDELARVEGRVTLAGHLDGSDAKQQLRLAHSDQRQSVLDEATEFLLAKEHDLLREFANGDEVDPHLIDPVVIPVRTPNEADLFRYASLTWSVPVSQGYGRRTRFLVKDRNNGKLMAIFALGDPVIQQSTRDSVIGWTKEQRERRLYSVYDAYVLGAVEPYRQLLAGKLVALLTLANETRDFLARKYAGTTTTISLVQKDPTPALITTSSALGRSSVYNRITFNGSRMFHSVGFTKGYGHFHFSNDLFETLREFVSQQAEANEDLAGKVQSSRYGKGPNWRFRVIRTALTMLEIPESALQHNIKREVFLAPAARNWDSYLREETDELEPLDLPTGALAEYYRERWAVGRAERYPGFHLWRRENGRLAGQLTVRARQASLVESTYASPGEISMKPYLVRIGTEQVETKGQTIGRTMQKGIAYLSDLVGPSMALRLADIRWENGEREVRGWTRGGSDEVFDEVVDRLRVGIYPTEAFDRMVVMDLRIPSGLAADGKRMTVKRTTADELSALLGVDVAGVLDALAEVVVGPREELLLDTGNRRRDLCAIFPVDNLVAPAVIWSLIRPIALAARIDPSTKLPSPPLVTRQPPPRSALSS